MDSLFEFPCDFPIKVMGEARDDFTQSVVDLVVQHAPGFDPATTEVRVSSGARYVSVTCVIRAASRDQLDALYRALAAHPGVKVVL